MTFAGDGRPVQGYPLTPTHQGTVGRGGGGSGKGGGSSAVPVLLAAIAIVIIIVAGGIFLAMWFVGQLGGGDKDVTDVFESEVTVAEDGHFRYVLLTNWEPRATVTVTAVSTSGAPFDVFLMDEGQYMNTYGNTSTGSFSAVHRWENVTDLADTVALRDVDAPLYLVIDNTDNPLLPGDAVPEGVLTVTLRTETTYTVEQIY